MMDTTLERISAKVRQARELDARPFGAETNGIKPLNPPLAEDEVAAIASEILRAAPDCCVAASWERRLPQEINRCG
jgi:hypothetical protein